MDSIQITTEQGAGTEIRKTIIKELIAFNEAKAGTGNSEDILITAKLDNGTLVGGLIGYTHWNWVFVSALWVSEKFRGRNFGTQLLIRAEQIGRDRGCDRIHLDTFEFQALGFYQKHGFETFGTLDHYPGNYRRFFLWKELGPKE